MPALWRFGLLVWWLCWATALAAAETPVSLAPLPPNQPFAFAVFGDNRGGDDGQQPAAFLQVLRAVKEARPAFAVNTGDMIYGRTFDEAVAREHWRLYFEAIGSLNAPVFHVPGNHDIWSEGSARLYRERCGPPYFAFDHGRARFIGLDCETVSSRLGLAQFDWLRKQLENAGQRIVFVFLHRPLFPVDGAVGTSMDAYPEERDQLHRLFVRHRGAIRGVFLGHEHLYHFHERDGVPYYITGGGGAPLYMAPELGGFHHFLLVRVDVDKVAVELKKVGPPARPLEAPRIVAPGEVLESWEQGLFWYAWNYTVTTELTAQRASEGRRGLQLNFDLAQCPWPVLSLPLPVPWDLRNADAFSMDVYRPADLKGDFSLTAGAEGTGKHEAAAVKLQPGWNTIRTQLQPSWLPTADRGAVRGLGWSLAAENGASPRGSLVFDNFGLERRAAGGASRELLESWERPLFWRVADESVNAASTPQFATEGRRGLKLQFDFTQCVRPVLLARLNPPWDLHRVTSLKVDVFRPGDLVGPVSVALGFRAKEREFAAQPIIVQRGWNKVEVRLEGGWLPPEARAAAEQVEWTLMSSNKLLRGWIVFDHLKAEGK